MARVTDIITAVRCTLADLTADRYSDTRLLSLFNQCLIDIVITSGIVKGKAFVALESNINTYKMPDEVLEITRVQYLDTTILVTSHDDMDMLDPLWETKTGSEVTNVVTNLLNPGTFKIFPRITDISSDYITSNSQYGIIIDITTFDDIFNLPSVADLGSIPKYLVVYYTKVPDKVLLTTLDADLQIGKVWDNAIIHYIAGMALRDDADQQNRAFGAEELKLYVNDLTLLTRKVIVNSTRNATISTHYKGGFEV